MSKSDGSKQLVRRVLKVAGTTYADEAGIRVNDKPMPLFQLLALCMLASKPIDATTAMRAARELFRAGLRTPKAVLASDRRTMISAFGRAADLREIAERSQHDVAAAKRMLKKFKGIGDTGADIYLREVQDVWTWVRPYFDDRATATAKRLGLPADPAKLGALAPRSNAQLAAALVRVSLDDDARRQLTD
jgi:hypothetical protein